MIIYPRISVRALREMANGRADLGDPRRPERAQFARTGSPEALRARQVDPRRRKSSPRRPKSTQLGRKSRFWSDSGTIFHGFWYRNRFRNGFVEKLFPNRFSKAFSKVFSMIFRAFLSNLLFCRHSWHLGFYRVKRFLGILVDDAFDESFS